MCTLSEDDINSATYAILQFIVSILLSLDNADVCLKDVIWYPFNWL